MVKKTKKHLHRPIKKIERKKALITPKRVEHQSTKYISAVKIKNIKNPERKIVGEDQRKSARSNTIIGLKDILHKVIKFISLFIFILSKKLVSIVINIIAFGVKLKNFLFHRLKKTEGVQTHPKEKDKHFTFNKKKRLIVIYSLLGVLVVFSVWLFWGIPMPNKILESQVPVSTKIYDRNGKLIHEIYTDKKSTPVNVDELPKYVVDATISIEDKNFYKHWGFSITGITRAAYNTIFKQKLQGGSTLTQQLVKNTLLTPERTIKRKLREIVITLIVEAMYSKKQILDLYFNQIPYGSTAYGIGAASELYFGKNAKDLSLSESAMLAGITAAPTKYSPFGAHPEIAKSRQEIALQRMVEDKVITQKEADDAKNQELKFAEPERFKAPHFSLWVKEILADKYGDAQVEQGGLRVTTTLDLDLQEFAETTIAEEISKLKKQKVGNGAAIVTHPKSGEILAMVGSKDYFAKDEDGKVNVIFANRQPGSSIKPINYALAIKDKKITLSTPLADVPTCFGVVGQKNYCPVNYDGSFHGAVQTRFALGNSYNIPAVRILALNGVENFIDFAKSIGITTLTDPKNYGLSLTLGGGEVKPYDMNQAFSVLANGGVKVPLNPILKITDWKGKVYEERKMEDVDEQRIFDSEVSYLISHALYDNNARVSAFGESSYLIVKGHPEVSVKTGTTNDRRDNWTIGYTPQIVTVVWVGNNDNTEMSGAVSGVSGASPIWNRIIKYALDKSEKGEYYKVDEGHSWPTQPEGIVGRNICSTTGNLPSDENNPGCSTRFEYFLKDNIGANVEAGSKDLLIDKTTGALAYPELPPELVETQNRQFLLDPLGTLVCLDCPIASQSAKIRYPLVN